MREAAKPFVGLLPLYLKMYDEKVPENRPVMQAFLEKVARCLISEGAEIHRVPICRTEREFRTAVKEIEKAGAESIVTLHLAYSPSLESSDALVKSKLPVIVLNTTPTYDFSEKQDDAEIMANHGIHGVQDMCSMLRRYDKLFWVEAGHLDHSDVAERVVKRARAVSAATAFSNAKIGIIGEPFKGMGDFYVSYGDLLSTLGIEVVEFCSDSAKAITDGITDRDVADEIARFKQLFNVDSETKDQDFETTIRSCLTIRRWLEVEVLSGFTFSFLDISSECGIKTMPFIEAGLAMTRGIGYAGEGDVLTAAMISGLCHAYNGVTFTEMFCPGWSDDSIFLSHMGEANFDICEEKPKLTKIDFKFGDVPSPVVAYGKFRAGKAVFVNLPIGPDGYEFIIAPVEMLKATGSKQLEHTVEGWFRPNMPISRFLEKYSYAGGTHHAGLVYDVDVWEMESFGRAMGFNVTVIE